MFRSRSSLQARIKELEEENELLRNKTFFCRPDRPVVVWLLANITGDQWLWYWRVLGEGYYWCRGMAYWSSEQFTLVDERYSDNVAIALWKVDKDKAEREQKRRDREKERRQKKA